MLGIVTATRNDCRCFQIPQFTEEIHDTSDIFSLNNNKDDLNEEVYLPTQSLCLDKVIEEAICEFKGILKRLECGIQPDLEDLLDKLSLIDINK